MKKFKKLFLVLLIIPCVFLLNACVFFETEAYVTAIEKTQVVGNVSTYTVYFSDGTHSTLTINDGKDGNDLTIESIKNYCTANKINFESFLKEYLTVVQVVEKAPNIQDGANIALQSTVSVWCEFPTSDYAGANKEVLCGCGAGVIYQMGETYSYIITNYHVVFNKTTNTSDKIAKEIHIFQYGTEESVYRLYQSNIFGNQTPVYDSEGYPEIAYGDGAIEATYVGGELTYDIAVLKVKTEDLLKYNEHAKPVQVADNYEVGETVMAIGCPELAGTSVTSGIISVVSENLAITGADDETECMFRVMRIDAAINGGNSGGGLFNINGEFVGTVNAKLAHIEIDNMAFALPYDNVINVADNIIHYYDGTNKSKVKLIDLGITITAENSRAVYNPTTNRTQIVDDAVVSTVQNGSVGKLMKFKVDDVIKTLSINGTVYNINRAYEFSDLLLKIKAGDKILIQVEREGYDELQTLSLAEEDGVLESYLKTIS